MTVVEIDSRIVTLKREDNGRLVRVVITGLSDEDQAHLKEKFPDRDRRDRESDRRDGASTEVRWPAPELTDDNLQKWLTFIRPSEQELSWRTNIRWHNNLATAQEEARRLKRPILLWTMNGNPCGET
jgi:hypothetical protein